MTDRRERVQVLYEISLAIGRGDGVAGTAREALSGYLRKLNCTAGAVFERRSAGPDLEAGTDAATRAPRYERVAAIPAHPSVNETYDATVDRLPADGVDDEGFRASLPSAVDAGEGRGYLLDLPGFGVLVLVASTPIPADTVAALGTLNRKLADACRAERAERRLREERDRFGAVFETIPEPVVDVLVEDDRAVVRAANPAFEATFDCRDPEGRALSAVVDRPDGGSDDGPPAWVANDQPTVRTVELETTDGARSFTLRSAPVSTGDREERFGLYVDVTDQRERERTLERLYRAAADLLEGSDRRAVAETAVEAATEVLEFTATGVHLYDRSEEALVPVATRGVESVLGRPPGSYTDRGSVVWETYRSESPTTIDDTERLEGRLPNEETETRSGMLFPLGDHGVLITSSAVTDGFDDSDRYFGGLLATMLRTALDRVGRERTLGRIQRLTGRFVAADDPAEVCEMLVEGAAEAIGLPVAGVWRHDRFDDRLVPVASTSEADDLVGDPPAFESGDSLAWQVFAAGEPRLFDDVTDESAVHNPDSPIVTEMIVPIEGFGVAAAGSPVERDFSETEFELFRTLVTGAESALRIVEQREELSVLDQILARVLRHNVRNDLSTIRGRAEVIAGRADGPVAGQARQIIETSDELLSTTEHAREMREAVDRREERTEIDLSRAVRTAVEGVRADHPSASIHVDADALCLQAHPDLSRAIRHAIENGVEHNDGPEPTVRVSTTRATDGVTLAVADDGPGIPDHELEPLSAEEETALSHGSGVGVWLIDRIVRYSGGSVAFDVDERGTTVSMRFDRSAVVE